MYGILELVFFCSNYFARITLQILFLILVLL
jgi:hypothetical protein